jgi:hypothetical protein
MNSQFIRDQIDGIAADRRIAYVHTLAARMAVGQLEGQARAALLNFRGGEDLANPANTVGTILSFARSDAGRDLAAARIVLNLLESSTEFKSAFAILNPLHQELAEAVEREAAEAHDERLALAAVEAAELAARAKVEARIQADPAVTKARQALAGIRRLGEPLNLATV